MSDTPQLPTVRLDEKSVLEEATRRAGGLTDFGEDAFLEPMRVLLDSYEREAELNAIGRVSMWERIVGVLVNRLRMEDWICRHPEILTEEIGAPVVIVGLMRTGTTMLHRLLSSDPGFNSLYWYESRNPAPFPDTDWNKPDPRIADAETEVRVILETQPELASIHPWDPVGPDEDIMLREHSFVSGVPDSGANLPSYMAWLDSHSHAGSYRYVHRMLQFLQWQKRQAGVCGDRWILKTPDHMGQLELLFEIFPDATVVQTHRDPLQTIPSAASMNYSLWKLAADDPDARIVGAQVAEKWCRFLNHCMDVRETLPPERFVDVWYRDVARDPMGQIERIYAAIDRELTPERVAAMQHWVDANPREARPPHDYTLEKFGLDEAHITREFARYRERFILPRGST